MYRFLQASSFLSFIKKVYIRIICLSVGKTNFNKLNSSSVSCSNLVSFCFLRRSPHKLLTSLPVDLIELQGVPLFDLNSMSSTETPILGLFVEASRKNSLRTMRRASCHAGSQRTYVY